MVPGTVGRAAQNTAERQLSTTISEGISERSDGRLRERIGSDPDRRHNQSVSPVGVVHLSRSAVAYKGK
jgi:hypothetical protein